MMPRWAERELVGATLDWRQRDPTSTAHVFVNGAPGCSWSAVAMPPATWAASTMVHDNLPAGHVCTTCRAVSNRHHRVNAGALDQ